MFHFELNELEDFCQDEFENDLYVTVQVEKPDTPSACPHCDAKMYRHGYYTRRLKDMPSYPGQTRVVIVKARRYRCPVCGHTMRQEIPSRYPGTNITKRMAAWLKAFLSAKFPLSQIAHLTGLHWAIIRKIQDEQIDRGLNDYAALQEEAGYKPRYLAVDEFAIRKMHKYATCVMDLETGYIIWAGMGRAKADFEQFFKDIPSNYLEQVEAVAMDMNASYNLLIEKYLPQAKIIYDRYHMQAQYGREVLGVVRLNAVKAHRQQAALLAQQANNETHNETREALKIEARKEKRMANRLKKSRWTLLRNSKNLRDSDHQRLADILESHEEVAICYAMKEEMVRLYELRDERQAREGWSNWFTAAKASGIPALVRFAELKEKRLPGLVAHATIPISTGKLEGFNNVIKTAKRTAYGYLNKEFFLRLIRFLSLPRSLYSNRFPR